MVVVVVEQTTTVQQSLAICIDMSHAIVCIRATFTLIVEAARQ